MMKTRLKAFWQRFKWVILSVLASVFALIIFLLSGRWVPSRSSRPTWRPDKKPPVDIRLKQAAEQAEEEALKIRVEAKVVAQGQREQLDEIANIDNGEERRKRLAEMLRRL